MTSSGQGLLPDAGLRTDGDFVLRVRGDSGVAEFFQGASSRLTHIADVEGLLGSPGQQVFLAIPFAQARENGYHVSDREEDELRAFQVASRTELSVADLLDLLPDGDLEATGGDFDTDDDTYAEQVRGILAREIAHGAGSNFVIHRNHVSHSRRDQVESALVLFRQLVAQERGAYWTFVVRFGDVVLVGASPEMHLSRDASGRVAMNPISGTLRIPDGAPGADELRQFVGDTKEQDELFMVVDEELKMMAQVCEDVPVVEGPYLRQLARVVHTEFLIRGTSHMPTGDLLRHTFMAPTVTGSPVRNAFRVIARATTVPRGYYGGILAQVTRTDGPDAVDSCLIIRTARVEETGRITIGVGATLVRGSDSRSETEETRAKVHLMTSLLTGGRVSR